MYGPAGSDDLGPNLCIALGVRFCDDAADLRLQKDQSCDARAIYMMHVPKTSGTALAGPKLKKLGHAFNVDFSYRAPASRRGHDSYSTCVWPRYKFPISPCLKLAVVRNPFDLLVSYYEHGEALSQDGSYSHSGWAAVNCRHKFISFDQFIRAYCEPGFVWHQPLFQQFLFSQLFNARDDCVADVILKYETLDSAIAELMKIGVELHRDVKNVSTRRKIRRFQEYYTPELRGLVEAKCARELAVCAYDFEEQKEQSNFIVPSGVKYDVAGDRLYI